MIWKNPTKTWNYETTRIVCNKPFRGQFLCGLLRWTNQRKKDVNTWTSKVGFASFCKSSWSWRETKFPFLSLFSFDETTFPKLTFLNPSLCRISPSKNWNFIQLKNKSKMGESYIFSGELTYVTSFFSISHYSNSGIDLKNVFETNTQIKVPEPYLLPNGGQK